MELEFLWLIEDEQFARACPCCSWLPPKQLSKRQTLAKLIGNWYIGLFLSQQVKSRVLRFVLWFFCLIWSRERSQSTSSG